MFYNYNVNDEFENLTSWFHNHHGIAKLHTTAGRVAEPDQTRVGKVDSLTTLHCWPRFLHYLEALGQSICSLLPKMNKVFWLQE